MELILFIAIAGAATVIIAKLFYSFIKSESVNKKKTYNKINIEENQNKGFGAEDKMHLLYPMEERPQMSKNNKWLYPADGFGKMEHGVVDGESKKGSKKKKKVLFLRMPKK